MWRAHEPTVSSGVWPLGYIHICTWQQRYMGPHSLSHLSKGNASWLPKRLDIQELLILLQSVFSVVSTPTSISPLHLLFLSLWIFTAVPAFVGYRIIDRSQKEVTRISGLREIIQLSLPQIRMSATSAPAIWQIKHRVVGRKQGDMSIVEVALALMATCPRRWQKSLSKIRQERLHISTSPRSAPSICSDLCWGFYFWTWKHGTYNLKSVSMQT